MMRFFVLWWLFASVVFAQDVLVYNGPGAGVKSSTDLLNELTELLDTSYTVRMVQEQELTSKNWEKDAALLVIPGGRDLPYVEKLNGLAMPRSELLWKVGESLLVFVREPINSSAWIEFAKGDPRMEVTGERELKFFPGAMIGPVFAGYDPFNPGLG